MGIQNRGSRANGGKRAYGTYERKAYDKKRHQAKSGINLFSKPKRGSKKKGFLTQLLGL